MYFFESYSFVAVSKFIKRRLIKFALNSQNIIWSSGCIQVLDQDIQVLGQDVQVLGQDVQVLGQVWGV